MKFLEAVEQFERIMNDSGHVRMKRLRTEEVIGTEECPGLIERYLTLGMEDTHPVLQDICLDPERMRSEKFLLKCFRTGVQLPPSPPYPPQHIC